jgi:RNA polymerase sigma factor (TIGR02999 family)
MSEPDADITELLLKWNAGEGQALEQLAPLLYKDLRRLAGEVFNRERPGHTLSATVLVHEVYLRLIDQRRVRWENRAHFLGAAAHIMRRVLVDHARAREAAKRGGGSTKVELTEGMAIAGGTAAEVIDLDHALTRLAALDPRKARIVEMKFFAGMTNQEVATALAVSDATVEREWTITRAWLIREMGP